MGLLKMQLKHKFGQQYQLNAPFFNSVCFLMKGYQLPGNEFTLFSCDQRAIKIGLQPYLFSLFDLFDLFDLFLYQVFYDFLAISLYYRLQERYLLQVAVGMPVTRHPPHRSVRAGLPHTAPALSNSESYLREIMACSEVREISIYDGPKSLPVHGCSFLTSSSQAPVPRFRHKASETSQSLDVSRYSIVLPVALHDTFQPVSCLFYAGMHSLSQGFFGFPYCLALTFAFRLPFQKEASFPVLAA